MSPKEFMMATIQFFCMALIVYFLLVINPARTKEESQQKFIAALKKNDEVVTSSGTFARVVLVKPEYITLEIAPNVRIKVLPKHVHAPGKGAASAAQAAEEEKPVAEAVQAKDGGKKRR